MPRGVQGGAPIGLDTSPLANLGEFGWRALSNVLALQQREQVLNQRRREFAAVQAEQQQARAFQQEQQYRQMEQADANRAIELVSQGLDPYSAAALAPRMPGSFMPMLDMLAKRRKEQERAEEAEKQQQINRGLLSQSDIGSIAPEQAQGLAGAAGLDPNVLGALIEAKRRSDAMKLAQDEAKFERTEARKDARARVRASGGGGDDPIRQADAELKLRKQYVQEVKPVLEAVGQAKSALAVVNKPVTVGSQQIIRDNALINAYARMLQSVGVLTDKDIDRAAGRIPGVIGSAETYFRMVTEGSVLDSGRRAEIQKNLRTLTRFAEKRAKDTETFLGRNARKRGLDPSDIFSEGLVSGDITEEEQATPGAPAPWDEDY